MLMKVESILLFETTWIWETIMDFGTWSGKLAYEVIEELIDGNLVRKLENWDKLA